ncbi:LytTR family DNA-binding domain-containing protein [Salipiger sp. H15]|uniref:LytTR family DNA-binding domain-containing protein n=1 Tax=Alloyangia sp. H15 TaxID=3029062 RepID=A0AAU8AFT8_9RHOB
MLARDLGLIDITGRRLALSAGEFAATFREARTWRYLALVIGALLASDPVSVAHLLPLPVYVLAWVIGISCYFAGQTLLMVVLAILRDLIPRRRIYWPLVSLMAMAPTLVALERGLELATGLQISPILTQKMGYLLVTVVMFETIFMRFVHAPVTHSVAVPDLPPDAEPAAVPAPRVLLIGAQPVPLDELIYLEARQHHVCAALTTGTLTLRTRLSDVLAQTRAEDGLRTHRSWWVARRAIRGLEQQEGRPVLRLHSGAAVPVARGRLREVGLWLAAHSGGDAG